MKIIRNLIYFTFLLMLVLFPTSLLADENFQTDVTAEYKILPDGKTTVTNTITIKNLKSDYYPKQYILNLRNVAPANIKAYESGILLKTELKESNGQKNIIVNFANTSAGKGESKTFIVSFDDDTLTQKTGEIWEVLLPKITDPENYSNYKVILSVPDELGELAFLSPEPTNNSKVEGRTIFVYENFNNSKSGISGGFGVFQVFSFTLNYHLEFAGSSKGEIAIPPDTSTQKMYYSEITPEPNSVYKDIDGNWIAEYDTNEKREINISLSGFVQLFSQPTNIAHANFKTLPHDTLPTTYWQSDDPQIIKIASGLNSVEDIYNYVINTLNYNNERVTGEYVRYGAISALQKPNDALCLEFTDLFITLARAKGIPAREINGYAYSQNPLLEPVSLVSDVLHSWPEYWNDEKEVWVPVDPTWGDTTSGVDFFNNFDLRHFAFVIHSKNPVLPYSAGMYKSSNDPKKDISVSFARMPVRPDQELQTIFNNSYIIPYLTSNYNVEIINNTGVALYNVPIQARLGDNSSSENIEVLLPFSKKRLDYYINYGLFALNSPDFINLMVGGRTENIAIDKETVILGQILVVSLVFLLMFFYIHIKSHKFYYDRLKVKIRNYVQRANSPRNK